MARVSVVYHNNCNSHLNYFSGVSIGGKGTELGLRTNLVCLLVEEYLEV